MLSRTLGRRVENDVRLVSLSRYPGRGRHAHGDVLIVNHQPWVAGMERNARFHVEVGCNSRVNDLGRYLEVDSNTQGKNLLAL